MDEYNVAYFAQINAEEGEQARRLADLLIWKYAPKSVLDVGCASGLYLKPFLDQGVQCHGVDFSEAVLSDEVLQIPRELIKTIDISKQEIRQKADLTLCIEVLEHIPASGAAASIKHLSQTSQTIFFSAAQPGQGGHGHINCQLKEYWQKLFADNGFKRDIQDEDYLRTIITSGYHMGWLVNNMMVFKPS